MKIKGSRMNSYRETENSQALEYASWGGTCCSTCTCTCCCCASVADDGSASE